MFRSADEADLLALAELERDAGGAALGHVFPPDEHPFPFDDVLARWRLVLDDPDAEVIVADRTGADGLLLYAAYDPTMLRHLAVHPSAWGTGLAVAVLEIVVERALARGGTTLDLWVLDENHRARRLYERLGWRPTGVSREAVWPPHPRESRLSRPLRG